MKSTTQKQVLHLCLAYEGPGTLPNLNAWYMYYMIISKLLSMSLTIIECRHNIVSRMCIFIDEPAFNYHVKSYTGADIVKVIMPKSVFPL